jgi:RHS repeat-associated protein
VTAGWSYTYDLLQRLISSATSSGSRSYTYDEFGNLTSIGETTIPVDIATNRLKMGTSNDYQYNDQGNLTHEPMTSTWTRRMRYDPMNRMVAAWSTGTAAPTDVYAFAYDQAGERVLRYRMDGGQVQEATYFLRDEAGNVLTELLWAPTSPGSSEGAWTRMKDYVYHGRVPIVRVEPGGSARHYITLVTDHLGSTRSEIFDASIDSTWYQSIDLWPYGELVSHPGVTLEKHLFTAHEREFVGEATGICSLEEIDYMHQRYYSNTEARFFRIDPLGGSVGNSQTWNRYSYVLNSPTRFIDPYGLAETICPDGPDGECYTGMVVDVTAEDPARSRAPLPSSSMLEFFFRVDQWYQDFEKKNREFDRRNEEIVRFEVWPIGPRGRATGLRRLKPVNMPGWRKIKIEMVHIAERHMVGGSRVGPTSTLFPEMMSAKQVEGAIRQAYRFGKRLHSQGMRVVVRGEAGGLTIDMWVNRVTKTIETAYPKL